MSKTIRILVLVAGLVLFAGLLFSQTSPQAAPSASAPVAQSPQAEKSPEAGHSAAAHGKEAAGEEEEENAEFKYAGVVRKVASATGLSKEVVYWGFTVINFVILGAGIVWGVKKALPNGFAPRTAEIKKGIEDARKASAEAAAKLKDIEARLARMDAVVAELQGLSEAEFSTEEKRIKAAAEEEVKTVVAAAGQEIAAAARVAQRDLKNFAAGLAVDLAEKKIKVDGATDDALVRSFAAQLGKDGQ